MLIPHGRYFGDHKLNGYNNDSMQFRNHEKGLGKEPAVKRICSEASFLPQKSFPRLLIYLDYIILLTTKYSEFQP